MNGLFEAVIGGIVIWTLANAIGLFALSRRPVRSRVSAEAPSFVFLVPALDEADVIEATLRHLLSFRPSRVVVVDDGSGDDTVERVRRLADPRVLLVRRVPPRARQGKGAALNAGYAAIARRVQERGEDASRIVVCVVDADGRLSAGVLFDAAAAFADPRVGACQVSVRIRNRRASAWTRMQHFEFVAFTSLYQRGRERTRAVGLGGNGQFARLAALASLGRAPWTRCLTEDQDLGIRLMLAGWTVRYLPTSSVSQQAVPGLRRLLSQRTRWFQGSLQCIRLLPRIAASTTLPLRAKVDLAGSLLMPVVMLLVSPVILAGWTWLVVGGVSGYGVRAVTPAGVLLTYGLAFLPALLLSYTFWLDEPDVTLPEAVVAAHLFVFYSYIWVLAGWRSVARLVQGRRSWTKTARVSEPGIG